TRHDLVGLGRRDRLGAATWQSVVRHSPVRARLLSQPAVGPQRRARASARAYGGPCRLERLGACALLRANFRRACRTGCVAARARAAGSALGSAPAPPLRTARAARAAWAPDGCRSALAAAKAFRPTPARPQLSAWRRPAPSPRSDRSRSV